MTIVWCAGKQLTRDRKKSIVTRPKTQLTSIDAFRVDVVTDNRSTVQAEVTVNDATGVQYCIGRGVSRRRPGDRWDPAVGETLAVARAFEDAAQTCRLKLADLGFGDVDTVGRPNADRPPYYFELYAVELRLNELEAAEDAAERKWLNEQRAAEEVGERQYVKLATETKRRRWYGRRA